MLHCIFPEEEVSEVADVIGGDKIRLCWKKRWKNLTGQKKTTQKEKLDDSQEKDEVQTYEEK